MKITINEENFEGIGTVVYYSFSRFTPEVKTPAINLRDFRSIGMKFRASRDTTGLEDFSEYSHGFRVSKIGFNNKFGIQDLPSHTKNLIGLDPTDLESIDTTLFPTLSTELVDTEINYFGSTLISGQSFYSIELPEGCWKVEFYGEGVTSNNTSGGFFEYSMLKLISEGDITSSPVAVMTFGPDPEVINNPNSWYFPGDLARKTDDSLSTEDYLLQLNERNSAKIAWLLLTTEFKLKEINLSYKSWTDCINPNRNLNQWVLRNDELYSIKGVSPNYDVPNTNIKIDVSSGNLISNLEKDLGPIYKRKLKNLILNDKLNDWTRGVNYQVGNKVKFANQYWTLLSRLKVNSENPLLSPYWILQDKVNILNTSRIAISVLNSQGGHLVDHVNEVVVFNTNELNDKKEFILQLSDGFGFSSCGDGTAKLIDGEDYLREYISDNQVKVTVLDWAKLLNSGRLVFTTSPKFSDISLRAIIDGEIIERPFWEERFEGELTYDIWLNDIIGYFSRYPFEVVANQSLRIEFESSGKYVINDITVSKSDISNFEKIIEPTFANIFDVVSYGSSVYNLYIGIRNFVIKVQGSRGIQISSAITNISFKEDFIVKFYRDVDISKEELSVISVEDPITGSLLGKFNIIAGPVEITLNNGSVLAGELSVDEEEIWSLRLNQVIAELNILIE